MNFFWTVALVALCWAGYYAWKRKVAKQNSTYVMPFQRKSMKSRFATKKPAWMKKPTLQRDDQNKTSIVIINLYADTEAGYGSYELLQALSNAHMRYGVMKIFHRHETNEGEGKILFSLASVANPGTFEIENMGAFYTKGLTMFTDMDTVDDPLYTFDLMIETAMLLAEQMGGVICEGKTSPMTPEAVERIRDQLYTTYGVPVQS